MSLYWGGDCVALRVSVSDTNGGAGISSSSRSFCLSTVEYCNLVSLRSRLTEFWPSLHNSQGFHWSRQVTFNYSNWPILSAGLIRLNYYFSPFKVTKHLKKNQQGSTSTSMPADSHLLQRQRPGQTTIQSAFSEMNTLMATVHDLVTQMGGENMNLVASDNLWAHYGNNSMSFTATSSPLQISVGL